ncbi:MAG: glycogen-binding domain-containing protein [Candidatus Eisenbacteria bacterium]|nr:glycogen-binding domain-containing protein [Candidatus Eisenbacteria bacterium]
MRAILGFSLIFGLLISGCTGLGFIKPRLDPPARVHGGYLFKFYVPYATVVQLAGNWEDNNWLAGNAQNAGTRIGEMQDSEKDGVWTIVVNLAPGRYQYKFVIDGQTWKEDPNNPEKTDDGYGGFNSLFIVK